MAQIEIKNVTFYYDDFYHPVFENLNLNLDTDWKLALIGRNGRGKSTLLKLLQGGLEPSAGSIRRQGSVSYFPYTSDTKFVKTLDVVKEYIGGLQTMELFMEEYWARDSGAEFVSGEESPARESDEETSTGELEEYLRVLEQYSALDGYEMESRINREVAEIGLSTELLERDFFTLSGGEQTCMLIIALFLRKDPFVLLDEPTNHLDWEKKAYLMEYLKKKKGYIIVSHDTLFLDQVTDHILAINKTDVQVEQGNYSTWRRNVELKDQFELRTRQRLSREIGQLERQSQLNRAWSDVGNKQKYDFTCNARANGAKAYMRQAKAAEQHIQDNLEAKRNLLRNMEEVKHLSIYQDILEEECLIRAENVGFCYVGESSPVFENVNLRVFPGDKLWIRGKNGAGKTTLLKLLAGRLPGAEIQYAEGLSIAYAFQEPKWRSGDVKEHLKGEWDGRNEFGQRYVRFIGFCELFDLPEGFDRRPLETLSSGELKKVDIARVLSSEHQVLFLDEPLNYMDVYFKEQLAEALSDRELTIVFVEHNEEFGEQIANKIIRL